MSDAEFFDALVPQADANKSAEESRRFRDALGQFATGIAVAICQVDDLLLGTTITSFNSVSLSPPLILFSLARSALSLPLWQKTPYFSVTILGEHQNNISNRFARGGADKWVDLTPSYSARGTPFLRDGLATFECETYARYDGGDHEIMVGHVISFTRRDFAPLLFFGGKYRRLQPEQLIDTPAGLDALVHGW